MLPGVQTILIDGYNAIRRIPGLQAADRHSLAAGRDALFQRLAASYRHTPHRVCVVFDGDGAVETTHPLPGLPRGQVIFTPHGELADNTILRIAAELRLAGHHVVVVTDDAEVRGGASAGQAATASVDALATRLNRAPRDLERRFRHRQFVREQLDADTEDVQRRHPPKGNPKRNKRRSRHQPEPPL